ncbi:MAG: hypothetical protein KJ645_05045, partial [Planctomycetes bacterium]|nr:hypothetical protein [Planctomycetota bacterium]
GYGYSISVPKVWKEDPLPKDPDIALYLDACSCGEMQGGLTIQVCARAGYDSTAWVAFRKETDLPRVYGRCAIAGESWTQAGSFEAWRMRIVGPPAYREYRIDEALVFTADHVIIMSYLYKHGWAAQAGEEMDTILRTFGPSIDDANSEMSFLPEGRTLGLERFGLYLELADGWLPEMPSGFREGHVPVALPSGGRLHVVTIPRVKPGMEELERCVGKAIPSWRNAQKLCGTEFGLSKSPAFIYEGCEPASVGILGRHGGGGFALVLVSDDFNERALLQTIASCARLLDPRDAASEKRMSVNRFNKALRTGEILPAREALKTLVLFSHCSHTAAVVAKGLDGPLNFQSECARALGRMGSKEAGRALEKTLGRRQTSSPTKQACMEALAMIGGEYGATALQNTANAAKDKRVLLSMDLRADLNGLLNARPFVR